jgi:hypothetical protein
MTRSVLLSIIPAVILWPCITASAQSMPDEKAYAIARDAYVYAYPIVTMDVSMRQSTNVPDAKTAPLRAPINRFAHAHAYPRAEDRDVVRYNFDTLYSPAWFLGLRQRSQGPGRARFYAPQKEFFEEKWVLPDVEKVSATVGSGAK